MPVFNIYEVSPPSSDENTDPSEPPRRVLAESAGQARDIVHGTMAFSTCFRYMKLSEVPWLSENLECVLVQENVDNPDGVAKLLTS